MVLWGGTEGEKDTVGDIYSETCLCDHLRNRDNLGIKGSDSSP